MCVVWGDAVGKLWPRWGEYRRCYKKVGGYSLNIDGGTENSGGKRLKKGGRGKQKGEIQISFSPFSSYIFFPPFYGIIGCPGFVYPLLNWLIPLFKAFLFYILYTVYPYYFTTAIKRFYAIGLIYFPFCFYILVWF